MAHTFGDYPRLAFAIPFSNLSFGAWTDTTYPEGWDLFGAGTASTWEKYTPGFDLSRALALGETGTPAGANSLAQDIALPDYIEDGQVTRGGACVISDLEGSYGACRVITRFYQGVGPYPALVDVYDATPTADWEIIETDSSGNIDADTLTNIAVRVYTSQYESETNVVGVVDCIKLEYGRTTSERYYTFTRFPELSGLDIRPLTFRKDERTGRGSLRSYDSTGGNAKWRIVLPFENVPASFVEVLEEFWRKNRGLDDGIQRPLCLTHCLTDPTSAHNSGADYLKRPPWIICNIINKDFPFKHSGSWLGAGMYNGTLTFEEI